MSEQDTYWSSVDPIWDVINIYDGPAVFLETFQSVARDAGLLYAAHFCQSEICNGGFDQFFSNSTGVLAPEAVDAFNAVGQPQIARIVREAMSVFGSPYPRERERRQSALKQLAPKTFDSLDERFYELISTENGGFELAADQYASRKH